MNSQILGLRVASVIFGVASILQLMRFALSLEVMVDGCAVPLWLSALAFVILAGLSVWMWRLASSTVN